MKPNHETIYLVPTDYDGGQLTYSWCDCPAPGEGMDPEDAIKYVRADLVPASNEVLARRIVELTNERDDALAQLVEVQDNRTGKAPCERFCEALATKKMFDNLQEDNRRLRAQVEQLRKNLFALITEIEWHHTKTTFMTLALVNKVKEMKGEA